MADTKKIFLGFKQVTAESFASVVDKAGYLWFVRDPETLKGDVYFGSKHYGSYDPSLSTDVATLKETVTKILTDMGYNEENSLVFAEALQGETTLVGAINKLVELVNTKDTELDGKISANAEAVAKKVDQEAYNAKVAEIESAISAVDEKAASAQTTATEALGKINAFMDAENVGDAVVDTLKEIQDYITTDGAAADQMIKDIAKKVDQEAYDAKVAEIEKNILDNEESVNTAISNLQDNKANTVDVVLKEGYVAYSNEEKTKLEGIEDGAQVNVIEKVTLFGTELDVTDKTVAVDFQSDDIKLGTAITTEEDGETVEVFDAEKTVSQTLQGIYDSLKSGLKGGVTSVTGADDSIVVTGDVNNKEIKVQISAAADNRLSVRTVDGEKGLYVEPLYYGGDDSEVE